MSESQLKFELKALAADGSFEGLGATYLDIDLLGDRLLPGAFTKTLLDSGGVVPLCGQGHGSLRAAES